MKNRIWLIFLIGLFIILFLQPERNVESFSGNINSTNSTSNSNKKNKILPVTNPMFNLREISKQLILLEDHLFQKAKLCKDCCRKHLLTIEALTEECVTLDKKKEFCEIANQILELIRDIEKRFSKGEDPHRLAQEIRNMRKNLVKLSFDFVQKC